VVCDRCPFGDECAPRSATYRSERVLLKRMRTPRMHRVPGRPVGNGRPDSMPPRAVWVCRGMAAVGLGVWTVSLFQVRGYGTVSLLPGFRFFYPRRTSGARRPRALPHAATGKDFSRHARSPPACSIPAGCRVYEPWKLCRPDVPTWSVIAPALWSSTLTRCFVRRSPALEPIPACAEFCQAFRRLLAPISRRAVERVSRSQSVVSPFPVDEYTRRGKIKRETGRRRASHSSAVVLVIYNGSDSSQVPVGVRKDRRALVTQDGESFIPVSAGYGRGWQGGFFTGGDGQPPRGISCRCTATPEYRTLRLATIE